jgi:hypothetical protein
VEAPHVFHGRRRLLNVPGDRPSKLAQELVKSPDAKDRQLFTQTASAVSRVRVARGLVLSETQRVRKRPSLQAFTPHIGS